MDLYLIASVSCCGAFYNGVLTLQVDSDVSGNGFLVIALPLSDDVITYLPEENSILMKWVAVTYD